MFTDEEYFDLWVINVQAGYAYIEYKRDIALNAPQEATESSKRSGWYDRIRDKNKAS